MCDARPEEDVEKMGEVSNAYISRLLLPGALEQRCTCRTMSVRWVKKAATVTKAMQLNREDALSNGERSKSVKS